MFEFAAFGFVTLVWWTWPAIAGIVIASMWLVLWFHDRQDRKREADSGPYPCLAHLGTDPEGSHSWCGQLEGHDGPHGVWAIDALRWPAVDPDPIENHWSSWLSPGEQGPGSGCLDPVAGGLCEWGEDGGGNESACWKPAGHDGPHMVMEQPPYEGDGYQQYTQ